MQYMRTIANPNTYKLLATFTGIKDKFTLQQY